MLPMPCMVPRVSWFSQYSWGVDRLLAVPTRLFFCKPHLRSSYSTMPGTRGASPPSARCPRSPPSLCCLNLYTTGPVCPVLRLVPTRDHSIAVSIRKVKMHCSATPTTSILHDVLSLHLHLLPLPLGSVVGLPHPLLMPHTLWPGPSSKSSSLPPLSLLC